MLFDMSHSIHAMSLQFKKFGINSLAHHGLITLIIEHSMKTNYPNIPWDQFVKNGLGLSMSKFRKVKIKKLGQSSSRKSLDSDESENYTKPSRFNEEDS